MRLLELARLALVTATLAACGGGSTTPAGDVVAGNYTLSTIDGQPLPWVRPGTTPSSSIVSGTLQVLKDGTFTERRLVSTPSTGVTQTVETTGSFTIGGSVLVYTQSDGIRGIGSVNTVGVSVGISVGWNGGTFVYVK